jgi:HK97 family phage major capsid protein
MNHVAPLELKDTDVGSDDPAQIVTKALEGFQTAIDDRLKALETKSANDNKLDERLDRIEAKVNRPGKQAANDNEPQLETKAFESYLRHGNQADPLELKTLTVSSDPQGGYLAPAELSNEFIRNLVQFSPIRGLATVRTTEASSVMYPKRTGITNAKWKGETQTREESEPTFGQLEVTPREVNTYVDISKQLLADSAGVAMAEVNLALAEDFGAKEGLAFVSGVGPLAPSGLMSNADVAFTKTGNASTLGSNPADLLIDFMYSLPAAYRGRGTWLMNSTTLAAIRKLKDGTTGVYLWQPSYAAGQPETILGRPVVEIPDMADIGAGTEPIAFGDIATAFRIIDRISLSILVDPYSVAVNGLTRIHATRRTGSEVVQSAAFKKIRCAV